MQEGSNFPTSFLTSVIIFFFFFGYSYWVGQKVHWGLPLNSQYWGKPLQAFFLPTQYLSFVKWAILIGLPWVMWTFLNESLAMVSLVLDGLELGHEFHCGNLLRTCELRMKERLIPSLLSESLLR